MSEDEEQLKPLLLQKKAWSRRELLEHIVDRHFNRLSDDFGDLPAWQVSPRKGTASECLVELASHLRVLGWYPLLDDGEPFSLTLLDIPSDSHPNNKPHVQIIIWILSFLFSATLGASWISYQDTSVEWYDSAVIQSSLLYFACPLFAALLFTSFLRKSIFGRLGVDGGHFLPAVSPIIFFSNAQMLWPFGLLGLFNQRLMQALVWPTRRGMLISGIVTPLSFMLIGLCYAVVGILMTPNSSPDFTGIPPIIQLNPITHLIATFLITPEELVVRTVWLHPLALVGQALMTFAWILLIPIPGLPGYRALWAILGTENMMDSGTELALYGLFLLSIVVILITSGFTPWLFLFGLGVWRMFSDQSKTSAGLITNDSIELDKRHALRAFAALFFALLLTFPGVATVTGYDDWEEGLALEWPEESAVNVDEVWSYSLDFDLVGVNEREVNVVVWADPPRPDWNLQIECGGDLLLVPASCNVGMVDLLNSPSMTISSEISNNSTGLLPSNLHFIIDDGVQSSFKVMALNPETSIMPNAPHWRLEPAFDGLLACTNVTFSGEQISGNFSTTALLWSMQTPENGIFTSESEPEVCLNGPSYGKQVLATDQFGKILPLVFINDEGEESSWPLRFENPTAVLPITEEGWTLAGKLEQTPAWLHSGNHVAWGEGPEICSKEGVREPVLIEGVITWDAETQLDIRIPEVNGGAQMIFQPPVNGVVAACSNSSIPPLSANYSTISGPALALKQTDETIWAWVDRPLESGVWELLNLGNESITIVPMFHHNLDDNLTGWAEVDGITLSVGESAVLNLTKTFDDEAVFQVAWLSLDEEVGVSGSIRLNFGSWCHQGTDMNHSDEQIECVTAGV
ncbi:MAG: hypothetical protein QF566_03390 [Candidatus Thalassarchaeaceae archaeon]|jgi:hypothetical protein|nr:hypothetical protein [Candidatus Thalassarchaeaceae archaeon]